MNLQQIRCTAAASDAALCRLNDTTSNPMPYKRRAVDEDDIQKGFTLTGGGVSENASVV